MSDDSEYNYISGLRNEQTTSIRLKIRLHSVQCLDWIHSFVCSSSLSLVLVLVLSCASTGNENEFYVVQPYAAEPLVDQEWIEAYHWLIKIGLKRTIGWSRVDCSVPNRKGRRRRTKSARATRSSRWKCPG